MRMLKKSLLLVALSSLLMASVSCETIGDFEGGYFKIINKESKLYDLDVGIKNYDDGAVPVAYADINGDS
jgi:hypothetical protein